jgi:hypothetical protein
MQRIRKRWSWIGTYRRKGARPMRMHVCSPLRLISHIDHLLSSRLKHFRHHHRNPENKNTHILSLSIFSFPSTTVCDEGRYRQAIQGYASILLSFSLPFVTTWLGPGSDCNKVAPSHPPAFIPGNSLATSSSTRLDSRARNLLTSPPTSGTNRTVHRKYRAHIHMYT